MYYQYLIFFVVLVWYIWLVKCWEGNLARQPSIVLIMSTNSTKGCSESLSITIGSSIYVVEKVEKECSRSFHCLGCVGLKEILKLTVVVSLAFSGFSQNIPCLLCHQGSLHDHKGRHWNIETGWGCYPIRRGRIQNALIARTTMPFA